MEDDLRWRTTFDGKRPFIEDDLRWKTVFDGKRPSMEDDLLWKTTFHGRYPSWKRFRSDIYRRYGHFILDSKTTFFAFFSNNYKLCRIFCKILPNSFRMYVLNVQDFFLGKKSYLFRIYINNVAFRLLKVAVLFINLQFLALIIK